MIRRAFIFLGCFSTLLSGATAATWHVPGDAPTIQAGIDSAAAGDVVIVAPGTYTGLRNTDLSINKSITLTSAGAILDCLDNNGGVWIGGSAPVVEGIAMVNSCDPGFFVYPDASATIRNCEVHNCFGGIWFWGNGSVSDCTITGNTYTGVLVDVQGTTTITRCNIADNDASGYLGGGIACYGPSAGGMTPIITDCTITGNNAKFGGGIYWWGPVDPVVEGNVIADNVATVDGGGVYCLSLCDEIMGNSIHSNIIEYNIDCSDPDLVDSRENNISGTCFRKNWTVAIFMCADADGDLEVVAMQDFARLSAAGSDDSVNIVVMLDRRDGVDSTCDDWTDCNLYVVRPGMVPSLRNRFYEACGEMDMGTPETVAYFARKIANQFPADHYMFVIWGHGSAWLIGQDGPGCNSPTEDPIRGAAHDYTSDSYISFTEGEWRYAFTQVCSILGQPIDIIAFDTCLNQMWECANEALGYCQYFVGSEESARGFTYDTFLTDLKNSGGGLSPLELANAVVAANDVSHRNNTLSSIDMSLLPSLDDAMESMSTELTSAYNLGYGMEISAAIDSCFTFQSCVTGSPTYRSRDLYSFADELCRQDVPAALKTTATAVKSAVSDAVTANSTCNDITVCDYSKVGGVAIHLPSNADAYDAVYDSLVISQEGSWDEFLRLWTGYAGVDLGVPVTPAKEATVYLGPPFPNPLSTSMTIQFIVARPTIVKIAVYEASGRRMASLLADRAESGVNSVEWDGTDSRKRRVPPGVYFLRLEAGEVALTRKVVVVQ